MSELKNPGPEAPTVLEFDKIPSLFEFLARGGVPGVEYLFVAAENQLKAQDSGWSSIVGMPFFRIGGIGSTLMARGAPIKDSPAQPGTSKCKCFADDKLLEAVKEGPVVVMAVSEASQPSQPAPKSLKHVPANAELLATK